MLRGLLEKGRCDTGGPLCLVARQNNPTEGNKIGQREASKRDGLVKSMGNDSPDSHGDMAGGTRLCPGHHPEDMTHRHYRKSHRAPF